MNSIEELVCDESFQQFCLGHDADTNSYWEDQLKLHPEMIEEARRIVNILSANQGSRLDHSRQLQDGLRQSVQLQQLLEVSASKGRKRRFIYAIAATGLILFGVWRMLPVKKQPATYTASHNPRHTYILTDGSIITLRENGTLLIDNDFGKNTREVTLTGEAFFDVKHNDQHPFIVHTRTADITVLGTTFTVSANPGEETETTLLSGKIAVNLKAKPGDKIVLQPNQKFITRIYKLDKKATPVWIHNRLEIDNEPLEEIAKKLEKWYGIPVIFSDEAVKSYRYSGTFESESIIKALEALQLSYPFNFKVNNNVIVISK
ncbi:FecR family protein [Chitinophaga sp. YR573]|uniref:FecR family protein n=1 Tax=Chitinophaga sp. YR573 TaxID=1881040 RepID=UPI0008ABDDB5|nr:FecR domain-containing protein [Chitinophaga sp. YR573]SEW18997.1 FecR family protein [Chitinophaga sp. YR573]